ncbi:hypothetical protein [Actinoplanes sp. NPDC049316]|uniref:hypothetical protein n=1 Tax=Actinoplanes sp. NPDC049316 TaxID=3154727 RepID=UPI003446B2EC
MSRRRRERPATAEEQIEFDRFAELAKEVLAAPPEKRHAAAARLGRQLDRVLNPHKARNRFLPPPDPVRKP